MTDSVIDLVGVPSPGEPSAPARARSAAASPNKHRPEIISLCNDSDDEEGVRGEPHAFQRRRKRHRDDKAHADRDAARAVQYKTDPNVRVWIFDEPGDKAQTEDSTSAKANPKLASSQTKQPAPDLPADELAVLEIFPDIQRNHLKTLLHQNCHQPDIVIMQLVENPSYPKETKTSDTLGSPLVRLDGEKWTYDFMSIGSFDTGEHPAYREQTKALIYERFPFLTMKAIRNILAKHDHHYAVCYDRIICALKSGTDDEFKQFQQVQNACSTRPTPLVKPVEDALAGLSGLSADETMARKKIKRKSQPKNDPILLEEQRYVETKFEAYVKMMRTRVEREHHKQEANRTGTGFECSCCYDTYAFEDVVTCRDEGHVVCVGCLENFARTKIWADGNFGVHADTKKPLLDLVCFFAGGCDSVFSRSVLEKALNPKDLKRYDELQCELVIGPVVGDDLVSCPKCFYKAAVPSGQQIFSCPVEGCRFESCRMCGEASHIPFRCDEIEKAVEAKGRVTVEEAITQAKVRHCPNPRCKQPFVKSDGCNKVACACGTKVCYICRKSIKSYEHFCQTPHCKHDTCNKCPLWTKAEEDDARAMREAGLEAASRVASATDGLKINVDEILSAGVAK